MLGSSGIPSFFHSFSLRRASFFLLSHCSQLYSVRETWPMTAPDAFCVMALAASDEIDQALRKHLGEELLVLSLPL